MKKLLLLPFLFLLLIAYSSQAQTEAGNGLVGGTAGFNIQLVENSDVDPFRLDINPSYAKFIQDNFALGGMLGLTYTKQGDFKTTAFSLLPFARYYFPTASGTTYFFLQGSAGLSIIGSDNGIQDNSSTAFRFGVGPGIAIMLTEDVSIDGLFYYNKIGGDFDQSNIGLEIGLQVFLFDDAD